MTSLPPHIADERDTTILRVGRELGERAVRVVNIYRPEARIRLRTRFVGEDHAVLADVDVVEEPAPWPSFERAVGRHGLAIRIEWYA